MGTQLTNYQDGGNPITADGLNTMLQTCDTMADLRGFIGQTGMQVYVRGFTAVGDGGQGDFYWNATGTGPDDDGVTNVVPYGAAVGCWTRIAQTFSAISFTADITSTPQTVPVDGSAARLVFSNVEFANGGGYDAGSGIFTPQTSGVYLISTTVYFAGTTLAAGAYCSLAIYRNGIPSRAAASAKLDGAIATLQAFASVTVTALFQLNGTTDNISVFAGAPGALTAQATQGIANSYISGCLIGSQLV